MSYVYHAMSSYFNRDNIKLPGFTAYFRQAKFTSFRSVVLDLDQSCSLRGGLKFVLVWSFDQKLRSHMSLSRSPFLELLPAALGWDLYCARLLAI